MTRIVKVGAAQLGAIQRSDSRESVVPRLLALRCDGTHHVRHVGDPVVGAARAMTATRALLAGSRLRVAYSMSPSRPCHCSTPRSRCRAAVPNCAATCPARKLITLTAAT